MARRAGAARIAPLDSVVETFAVADASGVNPVDLGLLPAGISAAIRTHVDDYEMNIEAALNGDQSLALKAMVNEPLLDDLEVAEPMLDEMLEANRPCCQYFF